ncbi:MAG TPA: 16S rRNA (cytosine(1402)-N(4))-methyltransferase RsmH [Virgibacillus sp.]|nr:16S rRNA (cytosine(1402)-N(4))-methyltransferase RsmH [Virgibacillus sp.]
MFDHTSVLREEAINGLNIKPNGTYVDCTVGGGGHALALMEKLHEDGRLIAFDQDLDALKAARKKLERYSDQVTFIHANFRMLKEELKQRQIDHVDGILFDLGVSSPQLDRGDRGFSYRMNAKLDMRMNQTDRLTAYDIVNTWSYNDLVAIFFKYGEERFSKQIARRIEKEREVKQIETTFELVDIIKDAIPAPARRTGGHPATRIFQALRIAVNDELQAFNDALHQAAEVIDIKGRIAVITFHSLEDRLCKHAFRKWSSDKEVPRNFPVIPEGHEAPFKLMTRKPIVPSDEEIAMNRRARSAILRIVEKKHEWSKEFTYKEGWK